MDYSEYMEQIIQACVDTWKPYVDDFLAQMPGWLVPVLGVLAAILVIGKIIQVVHMVVDYRGMAADMASARERGELW